jgi:two-component system, cell cycle sensor histidine kinase and response regulator CckA
MQVVSLNTVVRDIETILRRVIGEDVELQTRLAADLGLSTVYGIVKQSDGTIWVYSEPGKGATFKIYLPRTDVKAAVEAAAPPIAAAGSAEGAEVILLAEDETGVRVHSARVLRRAGYTVLDAPDGSAALAIAEQWQGPIHLLITDMIMPGLGGRRLAEMVSQRYPSIAVLFMSGYTDDEIVRQSRSGAPAFLQKPYTPASLARKVREVLDAARPAAVS